MPVFAVTADLHGYGREMLEIVGEATRERGAPYDAVLCVGDIGVFESKEKIDRATRKWAFIGKPELGIPPDPKLISWPADFIREEAPLDELYSRIDCGGPPVPILCTDGNHEDHEYLARLAAKHPGPTYPVDKRGRWMFFRRGHTVEIDGITITGCGGIRPPTKKKPKGKHLVEKEYERLSRSGKCDILMTHEAPAGFDSIPGDDPLREAGLKCHPRWWLFGHFHEKSGPHALHPATQAVCMGIFNQNYPNRPGIMGELSIDKKHSVWTWYK